MAQKRKQYPSQARLRELFDYDPEGFLVWRYRPEMSDHWNDKNEGEKAGSTNIESAGGFRTRIHIDGKYYNTMRLIWIYHKGDVPEGFYVKSRGGAFSGLKIELMELSESSSKTHAGGRINCNKHGYFGVREQYNGYFQALSGVGNRDLGTYETPEAAAAAYDLWAFSYYGEGFIGNNSGCNDHEKYRIRHGDRAREKTAEPNGFRGVCTNPKFPDESDKPWRAIIGVDGNNCHLGVFYEKEDAARAYNKAARDRWGEWAYINDVEDPFAEDRHLVWRRGKPKGVSRSLKKWRVSIFIDGENKNLGTFPTKEQAARAYNKAAYEHYGEHAVLNDIPDPLGLAEPEDGDAF